jgi:hypothetical protein
VVQVGAFRAVPLPTDAGANGGALRLTTRVIQRKENPGVWRVLVGNEATLDAANALAHRIQQETGEKKAFRRHD